MTEMTLKDIFKALVDRIYLVVVIPFVAVTIASIAVYYFVPPSYTANTTLYVLHKQTNSASVEYSDLTTSSLLTADYRELAMSVRVLDAAGKSLGMTYEDITKNYDISVTAVNNTRFIKIEVVGGDAVTVANLANVIGREFSKCVVEIMAVNNVNVVDYATPPKVPSAPKKLQTVALAGVAGLVLSVVIAIAAEMMNTTIRTAEDVELTLGLPVLARIPKLEEKK